MGIVKSVGKWDLDNSSWVIPNDKHVGRSFAFCEYNTIINDPGKPTDYIIIANGSRVEDHSRDYKIISEKCIGINNVIKHYQGCNGNYQIMTFLMDADAPIVEDAKLFARYVDSLSTDPMINTINIIGLSKCGAMNFYIPSFFRDDLSFQKVNLYSIASPYTGTKLASPLIFYPEVKKVLSSKIGDNKLTDLICRKIIEAYEGVSSNSHMDYDIAIPGGIPLEKSNLYDRGFVENIFSEDNLRAIKKLNAFKNMITGIDKDTLGEAIRTRCFSGIGLCLLDSLFFEHKSDGMVYVDAQREVEKHLDVKSYQLVSAHHDVNSNERVFNDVLNVVDDTIDETNDKKLVKRYY